MERTESSFGRVLKHCRLESSLTQEELATRSGVSARAIRRLEAGNRLIPRLGTVRLLAAALQLDESQSLDLLRASRPYVLESGESNAEGVGRRTLLDLAGPVSTLPVPLDTLVGRAEIMDHVRRMLTKERARLFTICGPPGIGKTRLAIEVGRTLTADFPGGVDFVALAPVIEHTLVISRIGETLGLRDSTREATYEGLAEAIGGSRRLLILDNMEHVLEAATIFPQLLRRCPGLAVLVTSRSRLRVSGERHYIVPPLTLNGRSGTNQQGVGRLSEADELFFLRARAIDFEIVWNDDVAAQVREICRRVDGLPLAIELAAAQLATHSMGDLADRVQHMLPLLGDGPRDQPARLQTMEQSIEWSYTLLAPDEQALLRRLSMFRGGFTLQAAESVGADLLERSSSIEALLGVLVERNLVGKPEPGAGGSRYSMLELIREFGIRRLGELAEADTARDAQARYVHRLAVDNEVHNWLYRDQSLPEWFRLELPNFREALGWLEASGQGERMLELAGALRWFWIGRLDLKEGQRWLDRALLAGSGAAPAVRAKGLLTAGQLRFYRGKMSEAHDLYEQAYAAAAESGDAVEVASTASSVAALACHEGDYVVSKRRAEEALAVCEKILDPDLAKAIALWIPGTLARAEHGLGNLDRADDRFRQAVEGFLAIDHSRGATRELGAWGTLAGDQGELGTALERYRLALQHAVRSGDERWIVLNIRMIGAVLAQAERLDSAARLYTAADRFEQTYGTKSVVSAMDLRVEQAGRDLIGVAPLDRDRNDSSVSVDSLSLDEAVLEALRPIPVSLEDQAHSLH